MYICIYIYIYIRLFMPATPSCFFLFLSRCLSVFDEGFARSWLILGVKCVVFAYAWHSMIVYVRMYMLDWNACMSKYVHVLFTSNQLQSIAACIDQSVVQTSARRENHVIVRQVSCANMRTCMHCVHMLTHGYTHKSCDEYARSIHKRLGMLLCG